MTLAFSLLATAPETTAQPALVVGVYDEDLEAVAERRLFVNGGRDFIRRETVRMALTMMLAAVGEAQADAAP